MSESTTTTTEHQPATRPHGAPAGAPSGGPAVQRQFVNFSFYRLDPEFRRLGEHEKIQARSEFLKAFQHQPQAGMICLSYSTAGLRADADFLLWRISLSVDDFQAHEGAINRTVIGGYLSKPTSFLAMTKRSMYMLRLVIVSNECGVVR